MTGVIRDASDPSRRQVNLLRSLREKKVGHRLLMRQIQITTGTKQKIDIGFSRETANERSAYQPGVPCYEYFYSVIHDGGEF
jgi:hypothetical protein